MTHETSGTTSDRELVLTRLIDAPRESLLPRMDGACAAGQWFAPMPWTTSHAELDVLPGGAATRTMRSPDGNDMPCPGVTEVVPNQRLVFTDAYTSAWQPSQKPFMTVILTFEDEGGKTRYTARVRHWTVADRQRARRWASTPAGPNVPTSSRRWWQSSDVRLKSKSPPLGEGIS